MLVVLGSPGTGKTYLCAALIGWAAPRLNTLRSWREADLLGHLRDSIEKFGDYSTTLKLALDDDFVIIDDIGSTPVNDWRKEIIFNAIDMRYSSGLPTVVTSNLTRAQISERYEPRTASRLFAKENTVIDLFGMLDMRQEGM